MKYTWIIFDADHTLFDFDKTEAEALSGTFAHFSLSPPPGPLKRWGTARIQA